MSFFGVGGGIAIPELQILSVSKPSETNITELSTAPRVLAKWKLDFTNVQKFPNPEYLFIYLSMNAIFSAASEDLDLFIQSSNDDITYSNAEGTGSNGLSTQYVHNLFSTGSLSKNATGTVFYIRVSMFLNAVSTKWDASDILAQIGLFLPDGVIITKLI